ncbi:hypothetical protein CEXT_66411 [Caerostris extrusa]|uniref:Uncharacterized protein n=1 Tax=Caerostris extrusa TaxID=172846 RepID=A0AAV4NCM9_CAEEX|nr:hypothetical protein CEXT_66411 [Caerostris extrusa]
MEGEGRKKSEFQNKEVFVSSVADSHAGSTLGALVAFPQRGGVKQLSIRGTRSVGTRARVQILQLLSKIRVNGFYRDGSPSLILDGRGKKNIYMLGNGLRIK